MQHFKSTVYLVVFCCLLSSWTAAAQDRVSAKEVLGTWQLQFDLKSEIRESTESEDTFSRLVAAGVSGLVQAVFEELDIRFTFHPGGKASLTVNPPGEDATVEDITWHVNGKGQLVIADVDREDVRISNDAVWMLQDGKLVAVEPDGRVNDNLTMVRSL
ncbi:MAG: hypothetical protein RLY31_1283 [Bacteroidota bacterium]